jgi:hypothetical protein
MRQIDHLVYCVPNLEAAMDEFENLTGVRPVFGGYHTTQGTKNALVGLSDQCYLELLAVDDENKKIDPPRWMGIDFISKSKMTRWALHSSDLEADSQILREYHSDLGQVTGGQRRTDEDDLLKWQLTLPGAQPEVEIVPFLIDWSKSDAHPADNLGRKCSLLGMDFFHPQPELVESVLGRLGLKVKVAEAEVVAIRVRLKTPRGMVIL